MMHFGHPETLYWVLASTLGMALSLALYVRWRHRTLRAFGEHPMLAQMASAASPFRQRVRTVCFVLAAVFVGIAATRPQWGLTNKPIKRTGVDVVFALDISKSMLARDAAPNRLDAAKAEIKELMSALGGDRVGLVVFTAVSFPQSPLTTDYGAIRFYLDKLDPAQMPVGGTSVGRAIMDAVSLLTGGEGDGPSMKRAKNQIIVLISDGEDHESAPLEAADSAATSGIKVVTVGFGSATGERIPLYKQDGTLMGYQRDRSGEVVRTKLDVKSMKAIADRTGGLYIPYTGKNSVATGVSEFIATLERSELESLMKERYQERFMLFLVPAFFFLLIGLALGDRRQTAPGKVAAILTAISVLAGCDNALRDTQSDVDRGNTLIESQQFDDAIEAYRQASEKHKGAPEIAYDEGIAQMGAGRFDEAQKAFARALETTDPQLRMRAMFNLGVALAKKQAWKEAYSAFKDAIVFADDTPQAASPAQKLLLKKNLEWVFHQLYPPCEKLEDKLEDNDSADQAAKTEKPDAFSAVACPGDEDWFRIDAPPGSRIFASTKFKDLREDPDKSEPFLDQADDFQVELIDLSNRQALGQDSGNTQQLADEQKQRGATRGIQDVRLGEHSVGVALRVTTRREAAYDVTIRVVPPCGFLQETSEPNDDPSRAAPLGGEPVKGQLCPSDTDWYAYDLQAGDSLFVDLELAPDLDREIPAQAEITLVDADTGLVVAEGVQEGSLWAVGIRDVSKPGRYLVQVRPVDSDQQGPYTLTAYAFAPCIAGDDRLEDNDDATSAATFEANQTVIRYLRLCDGDLDFFKVAIDPKKKRLSMGLSLVSTPIDPDDPQTHASMRLDLMNASGDGVAQEGLRPNSADEGRPPLESVLTAEKLEGEAVVVRVSGDSDFYHLQILDGAAGDSGDSNQDDQQQQDKSDQQDQSDAQDDPKDGDKKEDDQQDGQPNEQDDQQQPQDDGNQDEKPSDNGDEQGKKEEADDAEQARAEESNEQPEKDEEGKSAQQKAAEMQRIEDILRALESSDDNFQMRKALKEQPNRYIDKDW